MRSVVSPAANTGGGADVKVGLEPIGTLPPIGFGLSSDLTSLSDDEAARLRALRLGHFGDAHSVGGGVSEMRIDVGPGYRLYFTRRQADIVVLLWSDRVPGVRSAGDDHYRHKGERGHRGKDAGRHWFLCVSAVELVDSITDVPHRFADRLGGLVGHGQ